MIQMKATVFYLLGIFGLLVSGIDAQAGDLVAIQNAIQAKGAQWTAVENWITRLTPEERKLLCGTILEHPDPNQTTLLALPPVINLPPNFDWRNNQGNWVTPVKNQGSCGSCWDFSGVAQVESWWKIVNANRDSMIDLSEQFILSCADGSCNGGSVSSVLSFAQTGGIPTETCFKYQADDSLPCSNASDNWENEAVKIPGWGYITLSEASVENIKNAVYRHPVSAGYTVYDDFFSYGGGVYEHVWGQVVAGHAILIVGWNDAEQSWICKNSWGPYWGLNGYFHIRWGECGMGEDVPFIWNTSAVSNSLDYLPKKFDFSLTAGQVAHDTVFIFNRGSNLLEFSLIDYAVPVVFHPDAFMAQDESAWWCGDPQIGGYKNHWLQYLDTPILDLSATSHPQLIWQGRWEIEDPASAAPPYDGWDGCNVWISVDQGQTFKVIQPVTPAYNCQSLWSFGHPEQGWKFGPGIPGWGGSSNGWTNVLFDLKGYKSSEVVLRFAFASDMGFCTADDASVVGFFVDEIQITDGNKVLFNDDGNNSKSMRRQGFGVSRGEWLNLTKTIGSLAPQTVLVVPLQIDTRDLAPGEYWGAIKVNSNDSGVGDVDIPCNLEVKASTAISPATSGQVTSVSLAQNYPNPFNATTRIYYRLSQTGKVQLLIYNLQGEVVRHFPGCEQSPGDYHVDWDGNDDAGKTVASGVYLYQLNLPGNQASARKLLLLK
jgi:C1A family cysteine protease